MRHALAVFVLSLSIGCSSTDTPAPIGFTAQAQLDQSSMNTALQWCQADPGNRFDLYSLAFLGIWNTNNAEQVLPTLRDVAQDCAPNVYNKQLPLQGGGTTTMGAQLDAIETAMEAIYFGELGQPFVTQIQPTCQ